MIGDVMGTGGVKFSGIFAKMETEGTKSQNKNNSNTFSALCKRTRPFLGLKKFTTENFRQMKFHAEF